MKRFSCAVSLLVAFAALGCAHRIDTRRVSGIDPGRGHRLSTTNAEGSNTDELFVVLAFSGGGHRAAALSFGTLHRLRDTWMERPDGTRVRLLDEVDMISSVSGGSFTAAYYGLFRDRIFSEFRSRVLDRNLINDTVLDVINPVNAARVASSTFDRSDLLAENYHETIFQRRRMADLRRCGSRPFVVINAMTLATGTRFPFTQNSFDVLGSDLDCYPVANAVAASSAVPGAMSPIALRNRCASPGLALPERIRSDLQSPDRDRAALARALAPYHREKNRRRTMFVVDGGTIDNTGLQTFLQEYESGHVRDLLDTGRIQTLLVIAVNATGALSTKIDCHESTPSITTTLLMASSASVDAMTRLTIQRVDDLAQAEGPHFHFVEIALRNIPDAASRERMLHVPTWLSLEPAHADQLVHWGDALLGQSPEFAAFLDTQRARPGVSATVLPVSRQTFGSDPANELPKPTRRLVPRAP